MHGPNIGLGHNSAIAMFEAQAKYIVNAVRYSASHGVTEVEPTAAAQDEFAEMVDRLTEGSVWTSVVAQAGTLDSTGRNSVLWPATSIRYRFKTLRFKAADHLVRGTRKQPVS